MPKRIETGGVGASWLRLFYESSAMDYPERLKLLPPPVTRFYLFRHWLRDGGILLIFDRTFWLVCCGTLMIMGSAMMLIGVFLNKKPATAPVKAVSHVVDHRRDGTSQAGTVVRNRFDVQPKRKPNETPR